MREKAEFHISDCESSTNFDNQTHKLNLLSTFIWVSYKIGAPKTSPEIGA